MALNPEWDREKYQREEKQEQNEALQSVWTQDGQKDTVYMHQVQEVHLQHTHSKSLPLVLYRLV